MLKRALLVASVALAAMVACGDDDEASPDGGIVENNGPPDGSAPDVKPPPERADFGLDTRPSNTSCKAPPRPPSDASIVVEQVYANSGTWSFPSQPMVAAQRPGDASRWYIATRDGNLVYFPSSNPTNNDKKTALNIGTVSGSPGLTTTGEGGFLNFVFHPKFSTNGKAYVSFTAPTAGVGTMRSVIGEVTSANNGDTFGSYKTILIFDQSTATNHKGGGMAFGKDGFLYVSFGDGGQSDDFFVHGQHTDVFFAKVLRLDIDNVPMGKTYGIPADNPFASGTGGKPEIYAYGFRNPFRISIDRENGQLWVGDVGQNMYEEVDKVKLGGNYGWPCREGFHDYITTTDNSNKCPSMVGLIDPIVEHPHALTSANEMNTRSLTGGVVYRGTKIPALVGSYLYGDYKHHDFWVLSFDLSTGNPKSTVIADASALGASWVDFAEDVDGEVYGLSLEDSKMYMVKPAGAPTGTPFPDRLSKTGCKDTTNLVPYDVNSPLWSDGASKTRFLALPDGKTIAVAADGDFDLPVGSVIVKSFALGGKTIETRLLVRHDDGGWAGYSYEWLDDGSDAVLLPGSKTKPVGSQNWFYPGRADCPSCHTDAAGKTLGLEIGQLNGDFVYESTNRISNQLKTLDHIGMFGAPLSAPVDQLTVYPSPTGTAGTPETRARAWMHANCSMCHRPNGPGAGDWDVRFATTLKDATICNADPQGDDFGVAGAKLLVPGDPKKSLVSLRPHALNANRMPPLATSLVDDKGVAVLDTWITSLASCP